MNTERSLLIAAAVIAAGLSGSRLLSEKRREELAGSIEAPASAPALPTPRVNFADPGAFSVVDVPGWSFGGSLNAPAISDFLSKNFKLPETSPLVRETPSFFGPGVVLEWPSESIRLLLQ